MEKKVTAYAPATVANLVCGFDVLGLALRSPEDVLEVSIAPGQGIITLEQNDGFGLPNDPEKNVSGVALRSLLNAYGNAVDVHVKSTKRIKPGSGIGSSSASAAGGVCALNHLLGNPFTKEQLVHFAMDGEALASGARHADNVTPCIYGGITLVRSTQPLDIVPLGAPDLHVVVLHPQIEVRTADSRAVIKKQVPLSLAVQQWGNVAALVAGFLREDHALISRSLVDVIVEPVRSMLIPAFHETKQAALEAGALGGGISGSGPSIFMLCRNHASANQVAEAMADVYATTSLPFDVHVGGISAEGVRLEEVDEMF